MNSFEINKIITAILVTILVVFGIGKVSDLVFDKNKETVVAYKVEAPEGSIVNSRPPAATWGRTMISHLFPEIIFAAMAKIIPSKILASNGGSPANEMYLHGKAKGGRSFLAISQHSGGYGASELFDGLPCLCFPLENRSREAQDTCRAAPFLCLSASYPPHPLRPPPSQP